MLTKFSHTDNLTENDSKQMSLGSPRNIQEASEFMERNCHRHINCMLAISGADRNRDCDCKVRMLRQRGQKSDCGDRALEDIMADY